MNPWHPERYFAYGPYLQRRFGARVYKVSIDAGFTCPNRDGTVAAGGCTYCNNDSFRPHSVGPVLAVSEQIENGIEFLKRRFGATRFIAYFQAYSNTYDSVDRLESLYRQALSCPGVLGLAIGTRPDCVPEEVLDLLEELAGRTYLSVEYGLQTIHDR